MRENWPHAPPHYFTAHGTYIITAVTLHRKPLFNSGTKLDFLCDTTFELANDYELTLQAWVKKEEKRREDARALPKSRDWGTKRVHRARWILKQSAFSRRAKSDSDEIL